MSNKSQQTKKGGYPQRTGRPLPKSAYKFHSNEIHFAPQRSRVTGLMRPFSSSAFVAGNFLFVYKNCSQLQIFAKSLGLTTKQENTKEIYELENKEAEGLIKDSESDQSGNILAEKLQNELNDTLFSHCIHPNSGANFSLVFSVIVHQPDDFICPICLFRPVAPRVTHCGHIFCADCITQHISMCDDPFCPVCYKKLFFDKNQDSIQLIRADLRLYPKIGSIFNCNNTNSNSSESQSNQKMELHFLFKKIKRNHKNCVCFLEDDTNALYLPKASQQSAPYCHFMLADNKYAKTLLEKEKKDLLNQIDIFKEYNDELKSSFIKEIYESVCKEVKIEITEDDGPSFFLQESKPNDYFHFYQDSGGRLVFLDPLCMKMLSLQFGSIIQAPNQIEVDALKLTTISVDQHFRDRHRSLGHLPAGADITFVLADLKKIVSDDIYSLFSEKIEKRIKIDDDDLNSFENEPLTEADFPAMFTQKQSNNTRTSQKGGWASIKIDSSPASQEKSKHTLSLDDDFPTFGSAFPKKKSSWGKPQPQLQPHPQPPPLSSPVPNRKNDFPNLNDAKKKTK